MDRRLLLRQTLAVACGAYPSAGAWAGRGADAFPFALGVASGAPHDTGMVLWTRLAAAALPSPLTPAAVRWELADDERFSRIVRAGTAMALPELGHAVHVEVQGLAPGRWYHYRFLLGDAVSEVGRTRTAPPADALPDRLRFAFASCQRWEHGYYTAWRDVVAQSPDLVVFLGDYIYEYASPRHPQTPLVRSHALRHAVSLADYRDRYALHKSDADLRAAHRACPWIATWDDHEVANDYAGLRNPADGPDANPFPARRAAAYQAYYENMPLPASALVRGLAGLGDPGGVRVQQRHAFGRLARVHLLDTRQYRDVQACRDPAADGTAGSGARGTVRAADCPALQDPARTLLGAAQERWIADGLAQDGRDRRTRWTIVAQQTLFSPRHYGGNPATEPVPTDTWDGYPAARRRLLSAIDAGAPRNTVFVGGDIHQNYVCDVHAQGATEGPVLATEFCGTSITSLSGATPARLAALQQRNPQIVFANAEKRGYGLVDLTPRGWETRLRAVDRIDDPDSGVSTLATFAVEDGRPGIAR